MAPKLSSGKVTKLWRQAEVLFSSHRSALHWTRWRHPSYPSYKTSCVLWPGLYLCPHPACPPLPLVCYTGLLSVLRASVFSHILEVFLTSHLELERWTVLRWTFHSWVWANLPKGWWIEVLVPIVNNAQLGLWRSIGWRTVPSSVT